MVYLTFSTEGAQNVPLLSLSKHWHALLSYPRILCNKIITPRIYSQHHSLNNHLIMRLVERRLLRSLLATPRARFASEISKKPGEDLTVWDNMQFSKKRLTDFGDLPAGEIPEALKYSRPLFNRTLSNGVKVVAETWSQPLAAITVAVKAGSRNESLEKSGVNNFLSKLLMKGTSNRSKGKLQEEIHFYGGYVETEVGRETTTFTITYLKEHTQDVVRLLGDVFKNSLFNAEDLEAEKGAFLKEGEKIDDPKKIIVDGSVYTSFRDHMLGQPSEGIKDNTPNLTTDDVRKFFNDHYVGENITISAAGDINFSEFTNYVEEAFGRGGKKSSSLVIPNTEQPYFTPSLMFMRDDEITNMSAGISWRGPGWNDPDWLGMNFLKYIIGEYRIDKYTGAHLNSSQLQYNNMHTALGAYPDLIMQEPFYQAYSDTGIWGNFMIGNEMHNYQLLLLGQFIITDLAANTEQVEVYRARAKFWNQLAESHCATKASLKNAHQATHLGRILSRTELATKISHMNPDYMKKLVAKWFWDKDISIVAYGPLHRSASRALYNRFFKRSTLGAWGAAQSEFV